MKMTKLDFKDVKVSENKSRVRFRIPQDGNGFARLLSRMKERPTAIVPLKEDNITWLVSLFSFFLAINSACEIKGYAKPFWVYPEPGFNNALIIRSQQCAIVSSDKKYISITSPRDSSDSQKEDLYCLIMDALKQRFDEAWRGPVEALVGNKGDSKSKAVQRKPSKRSSHDTSQRPNRCS